MENTYSERVCIVPKGLYGGNVIAYLTGFYIDLQISNIYMWKNNW